MGRHDGCQASPIEPTKQGSFREPVLVQGAIVSPVTPGRYGRSFRQAPGCVDLNQEFACWDHTMSTNETSARCSPSSRASVEKPCADGPGEARRSHRDNDQP
jgi:hypothetical protein